MSSTNPSVTTADTTQKRTDEKPTCPNGHVFCPVDNPGARADALECHDCAVIDGVIGA
jgi:hypothetical protein